MLTREEIVKKVQACLALATSNNDAEAEAARVMAQKLLTKYDLSMEEVTASMPMTAQNRKKLKNFWAECTVFDKKSIENAAQIPVRWPAVPRSKPVTAQDVITVKSNNKILFGGYEWLILDELEKSRFLMLSDVIIERKAYHEEYTAVTWESCSLRKYLNTEFFDKFSAKEKAWIIETKITNENNPWFGTSGGNATNDRIFLLSLEEVIEYFGDSSRLMDRDSDGLGISDKYNKVRIACDSSGEAWRWWLRSPGHVSRFRAVSISNSGRIDMSGHDVVDSHNGGVRPALVLDLRQSTVWL